MSDHPMNDSSVHGAAVNDLAVAAAGGAAAASAHADDPGDAFDPAQQSLAEALKVSFGILKFAMFGLLVAYCLSGTFSVGSNEVALRLRFGDYVGAPGQRVLERGTYLAAPFPIEQVIKVDTRPTTIDLNREFWYEITGGGESKESFRSGQARPLNPIKDGSLLTGDFNIAHARWSLTYRVADPEDYITNVGKPALGEEIVTVRDPAGNRAGNGSVARRGFSQGRGESGTRDSHRSAETRRDEDRTHDRSTQSRSGDRADGRREELR
jgi:hypothetical protein